MWSILCSSGLTVFVILLLQCTTAAGQSTSASGSTLGLSVLSRPVIGAVIIATYLHNIATYNNIFPSRETSGVK